MSKKSLFVAAASAVMAAVVLNDRPSAGLLPIRMTMSTTSRRPGGPTGSRFKTGKPF